MSDAVESKMANLRVSDDYVVGLYDLPQEVLLLLFSFLYVEDLMMMGGVCRLFRAISKDHGLAHNYRRNINVALLGSCGVGKSTLVGHLMFKLGEVKLSAVDNATEAAKSLGRGDAAAKYTFIASRRRLDRERGLTTDNNYLHAFNSRHPLGVTFIDTPGHRDFIKNTIRGFMQSDFAIWVVDKIPEADDTYNRASSFYEAPLLIGGANMKHALVVINKMDQHDWNTARYDETKIKVAEILTKRGVKPDNVIFVPVSAATGWNLETRTIVPPEEQKLDDIRVTYQGLTLWEAIIKVGARTPKRPPKKPFRMSVVKMWNTWFAPGKGKRGVILGTVLQGGLKVHQKVSLSPVPNAMEYRKELEVGGIGAGQVKRALAPPGYLVTLILPPGKTIPNHHKRGADGSGWLAYNPAKETLSETRYLIVNVMLFLGKKVNPAAPSATKFKIMTGYEPICHFIGGTFRGRVEAIHEEIDMKTKRVLQVQPKFAGGTGKLYKMTISTRAGHIIEPYAKNKPFGRFYLTDNGWVLGAGVVLAAPPIGAQQRFGNCTNTGPGAHPNTYWAPAAKVAYTSTNAQKQKVRCEVCGDCFFQRFSADPSILETASTL